MIYNNNDLAEHIEALREAFEIIGESAGYSTDQLISIRNKIVEERGKYGVDWKDPEEKLSFDYYYCIEQAQRLEDTNDLSDDIRLRLWRFATKNKNVKALWDQAPYYDPKAFLSQEQIKDKVWKENKWKKK